MGRTLAAISMEDDPLTQAIMPPPDEAPETRAARERDEAIAKKRSDEIDSRLQAELAARRKRGTPVKVLLLGQSESGKSTTLKNFQLTYARKAWCAEKEAWRAVIQFNLVRSVNAIVDAVARELEDIAGVSDSATDLDVDLDADGASILTEPEPEPEPAAAVAAASPFALSDTHRALLEKLAALRAVQRDLEHKLGAGVEEDYGAADGTSTSTSPGSPPSSFRDITNAPGAGASEAVAAAAPGPSLRARKSQEFFVRSAGWKHALQRLRPRMSLGARPSRDGGAEDRDTAEIARARGAMKALWSDGIVREVVKQRRVKLLDCAEFFLNDLDRVADVRYAPSDDDIIRARLRTIGVQEHSIVFESGPEPGREWLIYDVGGSRSTRAQWPSYFDDVNAIIFLAPISCFDERLAEDARVNRLDDSLQLWKLVCTHKLLTRTELVLFLNKCDLLDAKLKGGVRFADYVKSYGDGANDAAAVGKFLKSKFTDICRHYSKEHRGLHVHFTSVVDTKATAKTLAAVQDGILRTNLRHLDLI